jgi:hypothetical protein
MRFRRRVSGLSSTRERRLETPPQTRQLNLGCAHCQPDSALGEGPLRVARALREVPCEGDSARDLRANLMAGVEVGIDALRLAIALALSLAIAL